MSKSCICLLALALTAGPAYARDQISIVGSSTVYPFATVVAEEFGENTEFKTPVIESTGTGGGMQQFCSGVGPQYPDITNASRQMKSSELELCRKNGVEEVVEVIIGNDGIAFANSRKGQKLVVTVEQLWQAMAAAGPKPKRWSEIDPSFPNAAIEILTPPPTSGTRDAWNDLVMHKGCPKAIVEADKDKCQMMREDGPVVEAGENDALLVQKLESNPDAFGIFGFSYLESNLDKIQAASINGNEISLESIQSYQYPLSRPLYMYVKKAHIGVIPGLREYVAEFTSEDATGVDGYLADVGLVPLEKSKMARMKESLGDLLSVDK